MLKNRQLSDSSEAAIWDYESDTLKSLTGGFVLEDLKRWVGSLATDSQVSAFIARYEIPASGREDFVAASNSLNDDFIGEDYIYEGRIQPKILFDYQTYVLTKTDPAEDDCVINTYIVHENNLTGDQINALSNKLGFEIESSINSNIKILY